MRDDPSCSNCCFIALYIVWLLTCEFFSFENLFPSWKMQSVPFLRRHFAVFSQKISFLSLFPPFLHHHITAIKWWVFFLSCSSHTAQLHVDTLLAVSKNGKIHFEGTNIELSSWIAVVFCKLGPQARCFGPRCQARCLQGRPRCRWRQEGRRCQAR